MKNKLFASVPNILFGALITIAPQTFAHACTAIAIWLDSRAAKRN